MYLTDLAFIEEGTPNYTEDGLVNFSKMRMVRSPQQSGAGVGGTSKPRPKPRAHPSCARQSWPTGHGTRTGEPEPSFSSKNSHFLKRAASIWQARSQLYLHLLL